MNRIPLLSFVVCIFVIRLLAIDYTIKIILVLVLIKVYAKLTTGKCTSNARLDGKTAIVTGSNTGIGKVTAMDLASRGAKVILACRNMEKAASAQREIIEKTNNKQVIVMKLDLESFESVRQFAKEVHEKFDRLDILVNNAGAFLHSAKTTSDGLSAIMQTNYFGPFLLTHLLIDLLKKSTPSRIVTVSSIAYLTSLLDTRDLNRHYWSSLINYSNTKLCNILMSNELARRLSGTGVTSNSLHPGIIKTEIFQPLPAPFRVIINLLLNIYAKNEQDGAQTTIYLAVDESVTSITGKYFMDCTFSFRSRAAKSKKLAKKIWDLSETFVNLKPEEKLI